MNDKLRAAAEAALEALSFGQHTLKQVGEDHWESRGELAMSALRAALAEPETPPKIKHTLCGGPLTVQTRVYLNDTLVSEIKEPYAKLTEPQQEPVAWGMRHSDGRIYDCIHPDEHAREPGQYTVPLYTIPPRREWQGLTDEEIEQLAIQEQLLLFCGDMEELTDIVRVVEQKLKEKNT